MISRLFDRSTTLLLLLLYALSMAIATLIERHFGAAVARSYIYNNPLFYLLQVGLIINFVATSIRLQLWKQRKYGVLMIHVAFIVILIGAMTTHLFGYEGVIHLREGESTDRIVMQQGGVTLPNQTRELPFTLRLDDFVLQRYPGSHSPSSFDSYVTVISNGEATQEHIYMNKILYREGFRIYQSSYDPDEQGTILTVNSDMAGTIISYSGYLLLLIGFVILLLGKNSYFGVLKRRLGHHRLTCLWLLLSLFTPSSYSQSAIDKELAMAFGQLQLQSPTGRVEPVNTYSAKLLRKISKSDHYQDYSSDQLLLGLLANPTQWVGIPFIYQNNPDIHRLIGTSGSYICFSDLFDHTGGYKLAKRVELVYHKSPEIRTRMDKDLLKLDERVNIIYSLQRGKLLSLFPHPCDTIAHWLSPGDDLSSLCGPDSILVSKISYWLYQEIQQAQTNGEWDAPKRIIQMIDTYQSQYHQDQQLSERQVRWELFYNKAQLFSYSAFSYMTLGILLLLIALWSINSCSSIVRWLLRGLIALIVTTFVIHSGAIALRWYISEQAPWSNAYESMIYVGWASLLAGIVFARHSILTLALASFLGGVVLFVAHLNGLDPEITPLVPVLKSYWLMIHVAVITASYGFLGMSFLIGLLSLSLMAFAPTDTPAMHTIRELRTVNELSLTIGLALLTIGTFLGAVWANESWGRYWGWDPKETWALITIIIYTLITHSRMVPRLRGDFTFSLLSILGLTSVLMTYFGVNYYLSGLHSYGSSQAPIALWSVLGLYIGVAIIALVAYNRKVKD